MRDGGKHPVAGGPVDYDNERNISDYPESRTSLVSTTNFLHDKFVGAIHGMDSEIDGFQRSQRISQYNQQLHGTALKLVVKGQSYLEPGDLISFKIRPIDADKVDIEEDHRFAGQYVITKIRHQITDEEYTMVLECAKDSIVTPQYAGDPQYKAAYDRGEVEDIHNHMTNLGSSIHR